MVWLAQPNTCVCHDDSRVTRETRAYLATLQPTKPVAVFRASLPYEKEPSKKRRRTSLPVLLGGQRSLLHSIDGPVDLHRHCDRGAWRGMGTYSIPELLGNLLRGLIHVDKMLHGCQR